MIYHVYILYNNIHDKYYIGQTNNINSRLTEHNSGLSKYTARYNGFWKLIYQENFGNRSEAMRREKFLKQQKNKNFYKKISNIPTLH
jgi:putative endonuclease